MEKVIKNKEDLLKVFDILHDAECFTDDIKYDNMAKRLEFIFYRDYFEDSTKIIKKRIFFFLYRYIYPHSKCALVLYNIKNFDGYIFLKSLSRMLTFNECQVSNGKIKLFFHEITNKNIEISFEKNEIQGNFKDIAIVENHSIKKDIFISFK
jgi:hypothetical protein